MWKTSGRPRRRRVSAAVNVGRCRLAYNAPGLSTGVRTVHISQQFLHRLVAVGRGVDPLPFGPGLRGAKVTLPRAAIGNRGEHLIEGLFE